MNYCNLGKTNVTVPVMGVGTMLWLPKENLTEKDLFQTYQSCLEQGMNFFDTAEIYGNAGIEKPSAGGGVGSGRESQCSQEQFPVPHEP